MSDLEQLAMVLVFSIVGGLAFVAKWALGQKKIAETRANIEAQKRIEAEIKNEVEKKAIDDLIADSNKRHGRE